MGKPALSFKQRFALSRFFQGEAPVATPITLTQRRIFILPTVNGFGMAGIILLLTLIAYIYNNNLVYMLAFLLASIFFVTILHTYKSLAGLVVQSGYAQAVFAGEPAGFKLVVTNPVKQTKLGLNASMINASAFNLEPQQTKILTLYAPTRQRGWQNIDTVTLSCTYPFGIFRAWSPLRFAGKVLVYPRPSQFFPPFPAEISQENTGSKYLNRSGMDEFNGVRAYQASDAIRRIHWRAYAKGQGLQTREYASEFGAKEIWLDYQATPAHDPEARLSLLCRWVTEAENAGLVYGLQLPGNQIMPDTGEQHLAACLEALALF